MKNTILVFMSVFILSATKANALSISYIEDSLSGYQNTYDIYIQGNEPFSAYFTEFVTLWGAPADTSFFLFDSTMRLVSWDDDSGVSYTSRISEDSLPGGKYHLTISHYGFWPLDATGVMFELPDYSGGGWQLEEFYENHPVSDIGGPLVGWAFLSDGDCGLDSFTLALEGANQLPEPASMLLFGSGLVGLVASRIRKKQK